MLSEDFCKVILRPLGKEIFNQLSNWDVEEAVIELILQSLLYPNEPVDDSTYKFEKFLTLISKVHGKHNLFYFLERVLITQLWARIKHPPGTLAGYSYRSEDGSGYSRLYSALGKAGSRYSLSARIQNSIPTRPPPEVIFDSIMKRGEGFREHPAGISALLFYLAIIATHDLFNTDHRDPNINLNSSYLDLSPLYGRNIEQQKTVRLFTNGLLKPDTFADYRLLIQPPGVGAILILLSRNHNYIAKLLLEKNEDRFKNQDEALFQTARLINCGYYMKAILHNYLRTILGLDKTTSEWYLEPRIPCDKSLILESLPTGIGNQVSLEFNYIYRWHPAITNDDVVWIKREFENTLGITDPSNVKPNEFKEKVKNWLVNLSENPFDWKLKDKEGAEIERVNGMFPDESIAKILIDGTENIAGAFGANQIPEILRVIELTGIESARVSGLCSLNDFRRFLNLKPYKDFDEMNPDSDVKNKLQALYGNIENVEMYPGLMAEKTKDPNIPNIIGSTLALPFTISGAILSDAVNLVRNDRFYTDDFNQHNLAYWNWEEFENSESKKLASGGVLHQLLLNHLPNNYVDKKSTWALYPFIAPSRINDYLKDRNDLVAAGINNNRPI